MNSVRSNDVWDLTPLHAGKCVIGSKWVYIVIDGMPQSKACSKRLQSEEFGSDYDETFCPVVRLELLRNLIAISTKHKQQLTRSVNETTYRICERSRRSFSVSINERKIFTG